MEALSMCILHEVAIPLGYHLGLIYQNFRGELIKVKELN
jgi:hypothetical protein